MRNLPAKVFQWSLPSGDTPAVFTAAETAAVEMVARRAKVNDELVMDPGLRYGAGQLVTPLKLTAGRKRHALVVLD